MNVTYTYNIVSVIQNAFRMGVEGITFDSDADLVVEVLRKVECEPILKKLKVTDGEEGATPAKAKRASKVVPLEERCCARLFVKSKHCHPKGSEKEGQLIDFLGQEIDGVVRDEANRYAGLCSAKRTVGEFCAKHHEEQKYGVRDGEYESTLRDLVRVAEGKAKPKTRKGSKGSASASESESEAEGSKRPVRREVMPPKAPAKPVASSSKTSKMAVSEDEAPAPVKAKVDLLAGWVDAETLGTLKEVGEMANPENEDEARDVYIVSKTKGAQVAGYILMDVKGKSMAKKVGMIWREGENKGDWVEDTFTGF